MTVSSPWHEAMRQVIRQRLAARPRSGVLGDDGRAAGLNAAGVSVDILQTERELAGIEALAAAAELHALELFDDRPKLQEQYLGKPGGWRCAWRRDHGHSGAGAPAISVPVRLQHRSNNVQFDV